MVVSSLFLAILLASPAVGDDPPRKPAAPARPAAAPVDPGQALALYNARAAKTPETPAAQWELANWCEKNGLNVEAQLHYGVVVKLDPSRDAAWRKLGFSKRNGLWLSPDEVAEEAKQKEADALWGPKLKAIHKDIHAAGAKQEAAEEALAQINDPRAVPSLFREFGRSGATDQLIAVRALGQVDSPLSSRLLATLAIYGLKPEIRRQSVETLRGRDPDVYLKVLVSFLATPLRYEVKPVGGLDDPGELFVNGKQYNIRLTYASVVPQASPLSFYRPGDVIAYDEQGNLSVIFGRERRQFDPIAGTFDPGTQKQMFRVTIAGAGTRISGADLYVQSLRANNALNGKLQNDIAAIEELNRQYKRFNEIVVKAASDAAGKTIAEDADQLRTLAKQRGLYHEWPEKQPAKPTFESLVPAELQPLAHSGPILQFFKVAPFN